MYIVTTCSFAIISSLTRYPNESAVGLKLIAIQILENEGNKFPNGLTNTVLYLNVYRRWLGSSTIETFFFSQYFQDICNFIMRPLDPRYKNLNSYIFAIFH